MSSWSAALTLAHVIGLALAVGSATVKLSLLLRCRAEPGFASTFLAVSGPVTRQILIGMILLTLSGIAWLFLGYGPTPRLVVKLALFALIWVLGPVIDKVVEPRFRSVAPGPGEPATAAFGRALSRYLMWEAIATLLFYVIILMWVFRS